MEPRRRSRSAWRVGLALAVVLLAAWLRYREDQSRNVPSPKGAKPPAVEAPDTGPAPAASSERSENQGGANSGYLVDSVVLRDVNGQVVYRGAVDLTATVQRVEAGARLDRFRQDGSTFQNRERRLPAKPAGYYREYVHPTPGLDGPGPQRIVAGEGGELYYTHDHYRTFRRLK